MKNSNAFNCSKKYLHLLLAGALSSVSLSAPAAMVFINEFHYDNNGGDVGEGVEIAGAAGTELTDWSLLFYNGSNGEVYKTETLEGTIADQSNGFGVLSFLVSGLQNGPADGIALVDNAGAVREFISYEGELEASNGAASGLTSIDVGIEQLTSLQAGISIQRRGNGRESTDFGWVLEGASMGSINASQHFAAAAVPLPATAWLFGSACTGLVVLRRERRRRY